MYKMAFLVGLVLIAFSFVFISFRDSGNKTTFSSEIAEKNENTIKLKMAHNLPVNSALHEASLLFAQRVKEKTNNLVEIEVFPNQILGNDHSMVELARDGFIDILLTPTAKMSVPIPSMQYADLPFLFPSREDAYELLDGEPGQMVLNDLSSIDLHGVTFWENGFKHFTSNSPLLEPNDFEGKKFRVMKSRIIIEQFKALGAEAVPIDFHATKEALKDGVVDGQENPLVSIVNMGFHDVQSDLTLSEHAYLAYVFSISKKTLKKLPLEIGEILISTAKELTQWEREETKKRERVFLETLKSSGVNIHTLTKEQKDRFKDATKYITKVYEDVVGSHIISKTEEILDTKYSDENTVFIGLDADLSMADKGSGLAIKRGIELALSEINADGGLLGKKVKLIATDHRGVSSQGEKNIIKLLSYQDVVAVVGGKHSAVVSSQTEYVQKAKIPFIQPWATASKIVENGYDENYIFRVSINDKDAAKFLINESAKKHKKVALIVENSIWGRDASKLIKESAKNTKIDIIDEFIVNRGVSDFNDILESIKEKQTDSIIMIMNSHECSELVENMSKKGYSIPIISHWGITGGDFFQRNRELLKDVDLKFIQTFSFFKGTNSVSKRFASLYMDNYKKSSLSEIVAPNGAAQAYDALHLLALAIKKAASFEGKEIKKALEDIPIYHGVVKTYKKPFSSDNHESIDEKNLFMSTFADDGSIVPVGDE